MATAEAPAVAGAAAGREDIAWRKAIALGQARIEEAAAVSQQQSEQFKNRNL